MKNKYAISKRHIIVRNILIALVILAAVIVERYVGSGIVSGIFHRDSTPGMSKKEYIDNSVKSAKAATTLPTQIDSVTRLDDIVGTDDAIKSEYTIVNVGADKIDEAALKSSVKTKPCAESGTRDVMEHDVNLIYSYTYENSDKPFSFVISKSDCK